MRTRCSRALRATVSLVALLALSPATRGHETDNFYLPLHRRFADLGPFLDAAHTRALERTVARLNADIEHALTLRDADFRARRLAALHDPAAVAAGVYEQFNDAFTEVIDVESAVSGAWARRAFPGEITHYWTTDWMYTYVHFPLDPRRIVLLFPSSTLKAYGVYFGSDKLSHFHHMGKYYYDTYQYHLRRGVAPDEARRRVIAEYSGDGPLSENGVLGVLATGVYSNADLVANYTGFKFLLNLTEPVMLKGRTVPPLVVREGVFWRLDERVRPESGWFGDFVSDHWNEALNPSLYDLTIRGGVRDILRERARRIIDFYTTVDHRPDDPAYFTALAGELATYYGEDYGKAGADADLMHLGNTCYPALREKQDAPAMPTPPDGAG